MNKKTLVLNVKTMLFILFEIYSALGEGVDLDLVDSLPPTYIS